MRRRQFLHAFGALAMVRPASATAAKNQSPSNLMPAFWRAYASAVNENGAARVKALAADFFLPEAGHYNAAGFNGTGSHGRLFDNRVRDWLMRLDPMVDSVRAVSDTLPTAWIDHDNRFKAANLISRCELEGCFLPSLFSFTGYSRIWNGRPMLFIAPDGIVDQLGSNPPLSVLIDYEAFHVFHDDAAPDLTGSLLWMRLWREGLATFASGELNPSATPAQVLMSADLAALSRADIAATARKVIDGFDQAGGYASLFEIGNHGGLPDRVGYALGLNVARIIGARHSLIEMAQMSAAIVRPALVAALSVLAKGS